ncbi:GntR family transcriptional regulator [Streptomyces sp. MJM1172]|uniref:GntR family transcriptional regulator n=1 Tax=Streptomyces sp. MJM1172 TaxID=1703926 RepID=UPI000B05F32A
MPREAPFLPVADVLRARILAGEWEIGERLPSRARLAVEYGVGRNVMQRAVDRLIIDGLLEGRAGSGTYLRMPRERLRLVRSRHHERQDRRERGRADAWDSHGQVRVPAPETIAERLAISSGELCVHTHYEFLAQANLLGISVGDLVLQIERTIFDTDGRPVETADMVPLPWSTDRLLRCRVRQLPPARGGTRPSRTGKRETVRPTLGDQHQRADDGRSAWDALGEFGRDGHVGAARDHHAHTRTEAGAE